MMRIVLLTFFITFWFASAQPGEEPEIATPTAGEALQGRVTISGSSRIPGFQSMEIAFSYDADPTGTWFILHESQSAIEQGELTDWDTTTVSDGTYSLRLRVYRNDGGSVETLVKGLRIRNYSPVETQTPEPTLAAAATVPAPTATAPVPTRTAVLSPTPLPPNPALVTRGDLLFSLGQGVLVTLAAFVVLGLYLAVKKLFHRSS